MSTLGSIFNCIKDRLNTEISWMNGVEIYQQQDIFQNESLGFKPPVVFVDFQDIEYETTSYKVQQGNMNVVIKLVVEEYTKDYLKVLDKKELVNAKLNNWGEWGFDLVRTNESTDTDADSLYVFEIVYQTSFYEEIYTDDLIPMGGTNGTWGLCLDLQIDAFNLPSPTSKVFRLDKCLSEPVYVDYVSDITTNAPLSSSFIESRTGRSYTIQLEDDLDYISDIIVNSPLSITADTSGKIQTINLDDDLDYVASTGGSFNGDIIFNNNVNFEGSVSFGSENGSAGGVYNFDLSLGNIFIIDFPNATIVDYTNAQVGSYQFILNSQTTSSAISFSSNKWQGATGQTIALTATANAIDMFSAIYDGSKMIIVQTENITDI